MTIPIKDIIKDPDIYPRRVESPKTIEAYAEALQAGARFPPILVQRIKTNDGKEYTIFLDGVHRARAYEQVGKKEIEAEYWKKEILNKEEWLTQLQLESARRNSTHGDRLSYKDKELQARKICERNPNITEQEIADALGVSVATVSKWVSDIKLRQKAERETKIYRLSLLGWTQGEIGEAVGRNQQRVSQILLEFSNLKKLVKSLLDKGESIDKIAEKLGLDLQLAWALVLEDKDDQERLEMLEREIEGLSCKPRPYDVWNFPECHELFGYDYEGRIPGQLILQLLYFYTKQGDLVVDPMAGSGTVVDACLLMGRRCLAYDVNPECAKRRADIRVSDAVEAIRNLKRKANLIFLDPPYFKKKEKEYGKISISSLSKDEYLGYLKRLAKECLGKLTPDGRLVLLMSDYTEEDPKDSIFTQVNTFRNLNKN